MESFYRFKKYGLKYFVLYIIYMYNIYFKVHFILYISETDLVEPSHDFT